MSGELWIQAEEAFRESQYDLFIETYDREPTQKEQNEMDQIEMPYDYYTDYVSGLADWAYESIKDGDIP